MRRHKQCTRQRTCDVCVCVCVFKPDESRNVCVVCCRRRAGMTPEGIIRVGRRLVKRDSLAACPAVRETLRRYCHARFVTCRRNSIEQ